MNQPTQFEQMINSGAFGQNQPLFNPYQNPQPIGNMIPIGNYGYNNPYQQPQFTSSQSTGNYIFQPVGYGYNPNPYSRGSNDYYNPFAGSPYQTQQLMNPYAYSYNSYGNYRPFMSMQQQQQIVQNNVTLQKLRHKIAFTYLGKPCNEEYLDELYNPNNKANIKTQEQIEKEREWQYIQRATYYSTQPPVDHEEIRLAAFMQLQSKNFHDAFDHHSLCQFIEDDFWKLQREQWIAQNIKRNASRDLASVYSSRDYNELLNMHRSNNPYINDILNISRYDNNIDDMEVGLSQIAQAAFERERRRRNVLEGKLPEYVSSPEVQEQRRLYTQQLMDQLYKKGAKTGV